MTEMWYDKGLRGLACAALLAAGSLGTTVHADTVLATVEATWTGNYKGGKAAGYVPRSTDPGNPLNTTLASGGGGLFTFTQGPTLSGTTYDFLPVGNTFVAFCIEFNEYISNNGTARTYNVVELNEAPDNAYGGIAATGMGVPKAELLATLLGTAFGLNGPPDVNAYSADFFLTVQFAIWEIVHETLFDPSDPNAGLDVLAGNAYWTKENGGVLTTIRDAAQALVVAAVAKVAAGNGYTADEVGLLAIVAQGDRKQDFVVWVDTPDTEVPLPAAAWLLLSGMAGVFGIARRRKAA
jgi:hypothetical protein